MKPATQAFQDSLYLRESHILADLYTFEFQDGAQRWTSHPTPVTSGATTWTVGPGFKRGDSRSTTGLETDTLQITVYPDATLISGQPMVAAAVAGRFDGIRVKLQRAYMATPGDASPGVVTEFDGYVSRVAPGATEIRLTVQTLLARLDVPLPKRLTMTNCPYSVYGEQCGVLPAGFTDSRTVAAGSTASAVVLSSASSRAVAGSQITFTSGALAGLTRLVRSVSGATLTLASSLPAAPAVGAALTVKRGCDKQRSTCKLVFNNLARYGGFPDTPRSESV